MRLKSRAVSTFISPSYSKSTLRSSSKETALRTRSIWDRFGWPKLEKDKQFLSYEGTYSKIGNENIMNQWRDIGSFMPNIGSIESLVEFYFNIMYFDFFEWLCLF